MSALRRLSEDDVKTVFDCVCNNKLPPSCLRFQIVVVGPNGMRLSPPSYEYPDGLYVLLRPTTKSSRKTSVQIMRPQDDPRIPSKLKGMVMLQNLPETCPWCLSGPQFPVPTAIQQRYCYPKGDPGYSSVKGGALWTIYHNNGKEDLEYRLLHIYHSSKRAGNFGAKAQPTSRNLSRVIPRSPTIDRPQRSNIISSSSPSSVYNQTYPFDLNENNTSPIIPSLSLDKWEVSEGMNPSTSYNLSILQSPQEDQPPPLPYQITPHDSTLNFFSRPEETALMCDVYLNRQDIMPIEGVVIKESIDSPSKVQRMKRKRSVLKQWTSQRRQSKRHKESGHSCPNHMDWMMSSSSSTLPNNMPPLITHLDQSESMDFACDSFSSNVKLDPMFDTLTATRTTTNLSPPTATTTINADCAWGNNEPLPSNYCCWSPMHTIKKENESKNMNGDGIIKPKDYPTQETTVYYPPHPPRYPTQETTMYHPPHFLFHEECSTSPSSYSSAVSIQSNSYRIWINNREKESSQDQLSWLDIQSKKEEEFSSFQSRFDAFSNQIYLELVMKKPNHGVIYDDSFKYEVKDDDKNDKKQQEIEDDYVEKKKQYVVDWANQLLRIILES